MIAIQEFPGEPPLLAAPGQVGPGASRRKSIAKSVLAFDREPFRLPWHGFGARGLAAERGTGRQCRREGPPPEDEISIN